MGAHIQWLTKRIGILRIGRNFKNYGDPWEFMSVIQLKRHKLLSRNKVALIWGGNASSNRRAALHNSRNAIRPQMIERRVVQWGYQKFDSTGKEHWEWHPI